MLPARAAAGLGGGAASGGGGSGSDRSEHHLMKALSSTDRAGSDYGEVRCLNCQAAQLDIAPAAAPAAAGPPPHLPASCLAALSPLACRVCTPPQGFIQFRLSGERTHLDVDTLNEQLKVQGQDRLRCVRVRPPAGRRRLRG